MEQIKINALLDLYVNSIRITDELLYNIGYSELAITELVNNQYLVKTSENNYLFINKDEMYKRMKHLTILKDYDQVEKYSEKLLELDPDGYYINYRMFVSNIFNENFLEAIKNFRVIYKNTPDTMLNDYNYYLFLLSKAIELPTDLKEHADTFSLNDIMVNDKNIAWKNIKEENKIRVNAYFGRLSRANFLKSSDINTKEKLDMQDKLNKRLVSLAATKDKEIREKIDELISRKSFAELATYLLKIDQIHGLTINHKKQLELTNVILQIQETHHLPEIKYTSCQNNTNSFIWQLIDDHNYKQARILNKEYLKNNPHNRGAKILQDLLTEICNLENKITVENKEKIKNIITNLKNNDLDKALLYMKEYLIKNGFIQLELYFINLIKLCIAINDQSFEKLIQELSNPKLEIKNYIDLFYKSIAENNLQIASIYLNIIKSLNKEEYNEVIKNMEKDLSKEISRANEENVVTLNPELLIKCNEVIRTKGAILLPPIDKAAIAKIYLLYTNITIFNAGTCTEKYTVIKYRGEYTDHDEILKLTREAKELYNSKQYVKSLNIYLKLLSCSGRIAIIYGMIGTIYAKLHNKEQALNYLKIAMILSHEQKRDLDYSKTITALENNQYNDYVESNELNIESPFEENDYGIKCLDDVIFYAEENKITIEEACLKFNLSWEKINIIKLIYAKEYYIQGFSKIGDKLLKQVEQSDKKDNLVIKLLEEIKKNKKLYSHQKNSSSRKLSLKIKS